MFYRLFLTLFIASGLSACDPNGPTNSATEEKPTTIRTDQLQAAAALGSKLVVVGAHGVWLESLDRGNHWQRNQLAGLPPLIDIAVCPNETFVALDFRGRVWIQDQQLSWHSEQAFSDGISLALTCDPDNNLWVVGEYAQILTSPDLGKTWRNASASDEDLILTDIQFITAERAIAVGEFGTQFITENSGESWQTGAEIATEFYPQSLFFIDELRGWVSSVSGTIYGTDDGGQSWQHQPTGTNAPLFNLVPLSDSVAAVGGQGTILHQSQQRWQSWTPKIPFYCYLRAAVDIGSNQLLVAGGNGCLKIVEPGKNKLATSTLAGSAS